MDIQAVARASEAELIGCMARKDKEPRLAQAAWETLYLRHVRYVWSVVSPAVRDEAAAEDIVVETFLNARQWAARQPDAQAVTLSFTGEDRDHTRRKVLRWLAVIAGRELKDHFRSAKAAADDFDRYVETEMRRPPSSGGKPASTKRLDQLRLALASLSVEEADALRHCLPWYDPDTSSFALPRGEASQLAASLGITVDTLRQRRFRALDHIAKHMERNTPAPSTSNPP